MVWSLFHVEFKTRKEVAQILGCDVAWVEMIYSAAKREFGQVPKPELPKSAEPAPIRREKGKYSNQSPYGIAIPATL